MKDQNDNNKSKIKNTFVTQIVRRERFKNLVELKQFLCRQAIDVCLSLSPRWVIKKINLVILSEIAYVELEMEAKRG